MDLWERIEGACDLFPEPHIAVFDWDGSCIENDCAEAALNFMARQRLIPQSDFEQYYRLLDEGKTREAYRFGATTLTGFRLFQLETLISQTMAFEGGRIFKEELFGRTINRGIRLRAKVIAVLRALQARKLDVWVVSASPEPIVKATMKFFGVTANVIGVCNVLEGEAITANLQEPLSIYEGKVSCIQNRIHPTVHPILGVGDSMNDFPMLQYCRVQAVVDRGNDLARHARANGWYLFDAVSATAQGSS